MDKTAIKNFAMQARNILRAMAEKEAGFYGVTKDGCAVPVQRGSDFETYKTPAGTDNTIYGADIRRRASLKKAVETLGFEQVIEETAYTWFNRIIAIRFMEVNDYLPTRVRVLSSENGGLTPDIVTHSLDVELNLTAEEQEKVQKAKDANKYDEAYRILFIKQCNELNDILPGLFERTDDYMELLLKVSYTGDSVIRLLVDSVAEDNFNVETEGQVEIIGWMYQYYNTEPKERIINVLRGGIVKKEDIPAATQLFTTDWVVRYIVDNTLGRYWIERHPDSVIKDKLSFFVNSKKSCVRIINENVKPEELRVLDNCMGSGHFLVYAIEVLMLIYEECGYTRRDAVSSILEKNIVGLDIDGRAYQLAYFAVMMKARQYDRRILSKGVLPRLFAIDESNTIPQAAYDWLPDKEKETAKYIYELFRDAKELGSIIKVEPKDYESLRIALSKWKDKTELTIEDYLLDKEIDKLILLCEQAEVMCGKYTVVVTNPPYLNKFDSRLKGYINDNYKDYSGDLFSVFMMRNFDNCIDSGYTGFMTPYVWMFIKTYEKMRSFIVNEKNIVSLIQMEYSAFEEATVPICSFVLKNSLSGDEGLYFRLTEFKGGMKVQGEKVREALRSERCNYFYESMQDKFSEIPGTPIAYWVTEELIEAFKNKKVGDFAQPRQGFATGDNNKFLRLWHEVDIERINFNGRHLEVNTGKWFPCNKGGAFRKWFGNNYYVVNWENDGRDMKNFNGSVIRNPGYYFRDGITWSTIGSAQLSMRYSPKGFLFESKGSVCFFDNEKDLPYVLGIVNSKVVYNILLVLAPTLDFHEGPIGRIPVKYDDSKYQEVCQEVNENIELCRWDWNCFETAWEFDEHPLVKLSKRLWDTTAVEASMHYFYGCHSKVSCPVELCFMLWQGECNERFKKLKENEEELNRIFIDIYGLRDELTPAVEDKDITVRKADLGRDIRSLISYAVGCMFGRYSLAKPGLVYAGGKFDNSLYGDFPADDDAIIPITDEAYFDDDIVGRFEEFIKVVYGADFLEENLKYIAEALGTKGATPREKIRNYFLNDFFKDHCNTYSVTGSGKRPIYWLFDSGKQNGFKALIYMHRYTPDTVGLVRSVYLKKVSDAIEASLKNAEYIISENASAVDVAQATKKRDKYVKQLAEIKPYYQALSHVAMQRIPLDLDDGVKVNYAKFQGIEVAEDGGKRQTIDLLAKI